MRRVNELDSRFNRGFIGKDELVFDQRNLDGFNKRQLRSLIKRHASRAMRGNFYSFQIANAAAYRRTILNAND
jgi:hypothetical protein